MTARQANSEPIKSVKDGFSSLEGGVNSGIAPLLLPRNQLSFATNITVRGSYPTHRPPYIKQTLNFGGDEALQTSFLKGLWQGACYYKPDTGSESLICSISGHLFKLTPSVSGWVITDVSVPGDYNNPSVTQSWLWQAEKWIIQTDGTTALPVFFDGTSSRRSIGNVLQMLNITAAGTDVAGTNNTLPTTGGSLYVNLLMAPAPAWAVGTPIIGVGIGEYVVAAQVSATRYELTRTYDPGGTSPIKGGTVITMPQNIYPELPSGRMGAYGMGRLWMSLIDGKQFLAGDINGALSGTIGNNYRDAVLRVSENSYLAGGGYFSTPGAWGDIRAMIFTSTLDTSMGQGPLLVLTPTRTFSCWAPTDRTTWANVTNPILTEALITNGAEGHYSTVTANGDAIFRAVDGIRSLVIGRRDFQTWGNVPISGEMDRVLSLDTEELLVYSSAIVFDNRLLMTAGPSAVPGRGVFHPGLVALNFDPLSTMRSKAPSVYDGLWTGVNALQLVVGRFSSTERAFAFTYNLTTEEIELYEIMPTPRDVFSTEEWPLDIEIYDNEIEPITWTGESSVVFKAEDFREQPFHRLNDGELIIDNLIGTVDFELYYKPDQYPCWVPWFNWSECAPKTAPNSKPQFRPRMGLGEPPIRDALGNSLCDPITNRPFREGYTFQIKWIIRGHCRVLGFRAKAILAPDPQFAPQQCKRPCSDVVVT